MVIFLNGTSSAGKSSIAREILKQSKEPLLYYSVDHIGSHWLDEKFFSSDQEPSEGWEHEWFLFKQAEDEQGHLIAKPTDGMKAQKLRQDMKECVNFLLGKGYSFVIDEVLYPSNKFDDYLQGLLKAQPVYLINVTCDLQECERRERLRGNCYLGLTRGVIDQLAHMPYDFKIDTTTISPAEGARKILEFIKNNPQPTSFEGFCLNKNFIR